MNSSDSDVGMLEFATHPPRGWLRFKRDKFGITGLQLAAKMGVSKQRISALEKAELTGAASLKTMRHAADALGCEFVYALVPKIGMETDKAMDEASGIDPLACIQSPEYKIQLASICHHFEIKHLGLYGSAARGELKEGSDINLLAEFAVDPSMDRLKQMETQFARLFGRKINIVGQRVLDDPNFVDAIMDDLKIIYLS